VHPSNIRRTQDDSSGPGDPLTSPRAELVVDDRQTERDKERKRERSEAQESRGEERSREWPRAIAMTGRGERAGGEGPEKSPGYLRRKGHRSLRPAILSIFIIPSWRHPRSRPPADRMRRRTRRKSRERPGRNARKEVGGPEAALGDRRGGRRGPADRKRSKSTGKYVVDSTERSPRAKWNSAR